jgi:hypothetical protein
MFGEKCCGVSKLATAKCDASNEGLIHASWFEIFVNAGKSTLGCFRPHPFQSRRVVSILRLTCTNNGDIDHEHPNSRQHLIESVLKIAS